jgi:hypothetical protein
MIMIGLMLNCFVSVLGFFPSALLKFPLFSSLVLNWGAIGFFVLTGAFSTRSADCRFFCRKPERATGGMCLCMLWTI